MQTFMPYDNFYKSAECLDYRRLGKQRVECKQILTALRGESKGWTNHPATKMWKDNQMALIQYSKIICETWIARGYKDTLLEHFRNLEKLHIYHMSPEDFYPTWFGNKDFHDSHKSNLLRKDPKYYSKFGWDVADDLEYIWPVS